MTGSWEKQRRILEDGDSMEGIYNQGKDELYQWRRVGDIMPVMTPPRVHPDLLRSGDAPAIQAAEALIKASTTPEWPQIKLRRNDRMTRDTMDALQKNTHIPEVSDFLRFLDEAGYQSSSQIWHYFKYKYQYHDSLSKPTDLDARFDQVLNDA